MTQEAVVFDDEAQSVTIVTLREAASYVECRVHAIATDPQHVHFLVSWSNENRTWEQTRASFKKAVTIKLKASCGEQKWLSRDASRKQVKDRSQFDYLLKAYLPKHRGRKWDERVGGYKTLVELQQRLSDKA